MIAQLDPSYIKIRPWKLWSRLISYAFFEGRPLTTRGQWINPLIFKVFSIEKLFPQIRQVRRPVFILGTGRSGTTILGMVMSMHRRVGFLNEPKALWHSIYSGEDLIGSYNQGSAQYRLFSNEATTKIIKNAHKLFGTYLAATFSSCVVDKYPELIFRVPFVKKIFPDAKFLFLVRNGWDTCHSIKAWSSRLGKQVCAETHDWWGINRRKWHLLIEQIAPEHDDFVTHLDEIHSWTEHTDMAALEWILSMREGLKLLREYPGDVKRVTFEDLCTTPHQELSNIIKFLDLENDEKFMEYGGMTLRPVAGKPPFPLNPIIRDPFFHTMGDLGYEN